MIRVVAGLHRFVGAPDYSLLHRGHAAGGPQDRFSCQLGNRMAGNPASSGAIEITLVARAELSVIESCSIVFAGAPCEIQVDGISQPDWSAIDIAAGATVRIRPGPTGCRVYVCVMGGVAPSEQADQYMRSHSSSHSTSRKYTRQIVDEITKRSLQWQPPNGTLRIVRGCDFATEEFDNAIVGELQKTWDIAPQSSGMGLKLTGHKLPLPSYDIVSSPVTDGTIQATESGLIALLRQRGTLGGYPRVATVIDVDVDRLAQFRPGNQVRFTWVDAGESLRLSQLRANAMRIE